MNSTLPFSATQLPIEQYLEHLHVGNALCKALVGAKMAKPCLSFRTSNSQQR